MTEFLWIVWLLLAALFMVAEVFTTGFVLFWFGIGAALASLVAMAGFGGIGLQTAVFLISSIVLTAFSRAIFLKYLTSENSAATLKVGTQSLPGQVGIVVTPSRGIQREAEIKVYGSIWKALPADDLELSEGQEVEIIRVDGNSLHVRLAEREPSWRSACDLDNRRTKH